MASDSATVLVVDDDALVRGLVTESLESRGLKVITAPNGQDGLNLAKKHRPDLVLLDVRMPEMDGLELCRQLRRGFLTSTIPIIMLTSLDQTADKVEGMEVGADDYVTKPFDARELVARVTTPAAQRARYTNQPTNQAAGESSCGEVPSRQNNCWGTLCRVLFRPGSL